MIKAWAFARVVMFFTYRWRVPRTEPNDTGREQFRWQGAEAVWGQHGMPTS